VRVGVPVCEGIGWLADQDEGLDSVVFARNISPEDLAVRMGGTPRQPLRSWAVYSIQECPPADTSVVINQALLVP
jgi:hypothetical protein